MPDNVILPPGVQTFNRIEAARQARRNMVITVFGDSKTGKTEFVTKAERPLYLVYLDRNPNLDFHLIQKADKYGDEVYQMVVPPLNGKKYAHFTQDDAEEIVQQIENFADWARMKAKEDVAEGKPGGTFVVDGGIFLKGYYEKFLLGESTSLGGRPKKGQRGWPSQIEYAQSNAAIDEFTNLFIGSPMDFIVTWEGRRIYQDVFDPNTGRKSTKATDKFRSSRPERLAFGTSAEVETLVVLEDVVADGRVVAKVAKPKIRIGYNAYGLQFQNLVLDAQTPGELKSLLLSDVPDEHELMQTAQNAAAVTRANSEGLVPEIADLGPVEGEDDA